MQLEGLAIDRSTLAGWVGAAAAEIKPVYLRMKEIVLASAKIVVDETRAPVLDPGRGRTKTGYFWGIWREDRPWGGLDPPAVVYTYAPGRGAEHATALLAGYSGIVHCDGYTVYKQLADPQRDGGPVTLPVGGASPTHLWPLTAISLGVVAPYPTHLRRAPRSGHAWSAPRMFAR